MPQIPSALSSKDVLFTFVKPVPSEQSWLCQAVPEATVLTEERDAERRQPTGCVERRTLRQTDRPDTMVTLWYRKLQLCFVVFAQQDGWHWDAYPYD